MMEIKLNKDPQINQIKNKLQNFQLIKISRITEVVRALQQFTLLYEVRGASAETIWGTVSMLTSFEV